jgi:superfamily II DNA helicase RecQ
VLIIATSNGKSLLFQLPAAMSPQGMTIMVVPLVSLRENIVERYQRMGIRSEEWNAQQLADRMQLVFVTPEGFVSEGFRQFMKR